MSDETPAPPVYTVNPRGGAKEARNPDLYCTAANNSNDDGRCHNYRAKSADGSITVCRFHGAAAPGPRGVIARGTIATLAEKQGIILPDVKPKDFPKIAAEVISWNLAQFAALGAELEKLRLLHSPIDHAREYNDIFGLLDQMGRTIATLTKAAAALPPMPDEPPTTPARQQIMDALAGIRQRMTPAGSCDCCGQPLPVPGSAVDTIAGPPEASEDGPEGPAATVVPLAAVGTSDGATVVTEQGHLL